MKSRTPSLSALAILALLLNASCPAWGVTDNPQSGYSNFIQFYELPYANNPGFGTANPDEPTIALVIDGRDLTIPLDTGSRALYVSADLLPANTSFTGFPGSIDLNSSGRVFNGTFTNMTVTFPDAVGHGGALGPATATMLVLVVQSITASNTTAPGALAPGATFSTKIERGNVTLEDGSPLAFTNYTLFLQPGQVANYTANLGILNSSTNFGVGFDRASPGLSSNYTQYGQETNAFLNLSQMIAGTMIAGYILTPTGVQLGLTKTTTGFAYTNLVPTGIDQVPGSPPDWQAPMGNVVYDDMDYLPGQVVIDIGIAHGILTLPGQPQTGNVTDFPFTVNLINSGGAVSYQINTDSDNILNPVASSESVALPWFAPLSGDFSENKPPYNTQFFNTGRNVLNGFDFLYDAANGYLGLKPNGIPVPGANLTFTPGFYPNPIDPIAPFIASSPVSQEAAVKTNATFNVVARGTPNPALQWQISSDRGLTWGNLSNGGSFSGVTTASLQITTQASMNHNQFRAVATSTEGTATSGSASLLIGPSPRIILQPMARTVNPGQTVLFRVVAAGPTPIDYAWYFNGNRLTNGGNILGANTATLLLSRVTAANAGNYYVNVITPLGPLASNTVALTLASPP